MTWLGVEATIQLTAAIIVIVSVLHLCSLLVYRLTCQGPVAWFDVWRFGFYDCDVWSFTTCRTLSTVEAQGAGHRVLCPPADSRLLGVELQLFFPRHGFQDAVPLEVGLTTSSRSSFTTNQQENDKKSGTACLESTEAALARFARGEVCVQASMRVPGLRVSGASGERSSDFG